MKVVIFGLGSIGKKHAELLRSKFPVEVYAYRTTKKDGVRGVKNLRSWKKVKEVAADAAIICNPTDKHIETAMKCAKLGMHLFIEKPL